VTPNAGDETRPVPDLPVSPFAILEGHAHQQPAVEAIWAQQAALTYPDFVDRVASYAGSLLAGGFVPGEVTGIAIRDEIGHLTCAMALLCLGTPQVCLPSPEPAANKLAIARRLGATQLVAQERSEWMDGMRVFLAPANHRAPAHYGGASRLERQFAAERRLDWVALYRNTSGSTSIPKTYGLTLGRLLLRAQQIASDPGEYRVLRTTTMESDSTRFHRICALLAGAACVFAPEIESRMLASLCDRARVSNIHFGTYKLASLLAGHQDAQRLPAFTRILTGGSRVPGALRQRVKSALTDNLWISYATGESGIISLATPDQHEAFPEGVGFPVEGVTVELVDAQGALVAPGEIGRARVRKLRQPSAYVDDPEASASFADGWFYPHDLLSRPAGGPLIFHARADDVMILNGINIYPSAIEDVLESHPDVIEAATFVIKSRLHGEIPAAAIVLSDAALDREPSHFLDHCRQALGMRGPRHIVIVDAIPRNSVGKPLRRQLGASLSSS
jgi:acyl-CoA synthetase (AMP-forming)/AMP-acid ligase II